MWWKVILKRSWVSAVENIRNRGKNRLNPQGHTVCCKMLKNKNKKKTVQKIKIAILKLSIWRIWKTSITFDHLDFIMNPIIWLACYDSLWKLPNEEKKNLLPGTDIDFHARGSWWSLDHSSCEKQLIINVSAIISRSGLHSKTGGKCFTGWCQVSSRHNSHLEETQSLTAEGLPFSLCKNKNI